MARLRSYFSKGIKYYSIIEDYKRNGKRTTRTLYNIGNYDKVYSLAKKEGIDVDIWLKNFLNNFIKENSLIKEPEKILIEKDANKLIPLNVKNRFNVGYLFLEDIYYSLKLDKICKEVSRKYKFEFDLNEVLSYLVFSRIIYPSSKLKTYELSKNFIETPKYDLVNIYRGLTYLNKELDFIQKELYNNSKSVIDRNTKITYFDCTNYYFDINEEDDLRKYTGNAKDKKSKPVVGMGLFMDGNGLPIAMNIFPGSASETKQLIPLQEKIVKDYDLYSKQTILCTDAAMCTDEIKKFNTEDKRAFVITQSIKKLKNDYQNEVFKDGDWRIIGDYKNTYKLEDILNDEEKRKNNYETIFYKIIPTETAHVVQDLIVTFQIKYQEYLRHVRKGQIERALNKIGSTNKGEKIKLSNNPNDYRRFIKEEVTTLKKEEIKKQKAKEEENSLNEPKEKEQYSYSYSIDKDIISKEEKYDGYYGVTTNLVGEIKDILSIVKNRWEIEESFRILKTDFDSGTIHLSREDRITAHFLTCYISLLIDRILEYKLEHNYTNTKILETLRKMEVYEEKGAGYSPSYTRTDLTDDLHRVFGFRTDFEIISYKNFEKIFKQIKY